MIYTMYKHSVTLYSFENLCEILCNTFLKNTEKNQYDIYLDFKQKVPRGKTITDIVIQQLFINHFNFFLISNKIMINKSTLCNKGKRGLHMLQIFTDTKGFFLLLTGAETSEKQTKCITWGNGAMIFSASNWMTCTVTKGQRCHMWVDPLKVHLGKTPAILRNC